MKLTIRRVSSRDFSSYRCVAKNSLGETDGLIRLDGTQHYLYSYYIMNDMNDVANSMNNINKISMDIILFKQLIKKIFQKFPLLQLRVQPTTTFLHFHKGKKVILSVPLFYVHTTYYLSDYCLLFQLVLGKSKEIFNYVK